jgi:hypothetical protein
MKIVELYEENGPSRSRNFLQAGAGAAQKWKLPAPVILGHPDCIYFRAFISTVVLLPEY